MKKRNVCVFFMCGILALAGLNGNIARGEETEMETDPVSSDAQITGGGNREGKTGGRDRMDAQEDMADMDRNREDGAGDGGGVSGRMNGGSIDKSDDEELNELLDETEDKFQQITYQDEETGREFSYNLFVPEEYDPAQEYPLILFIPDSTVVAGDTTDVFLFRCRRR